MRQLIRTPGSYWTGFLKGFFGTIAVFVLPLAGLMFEARRLPPAPIIVLVLSVLFGASVLVGVVFSMRRFLHAEPYRRALIEDQRTGAARDLPW